MKQSPKLLATVGGKVDKSSLSLRVFGDDVDPVVITKLLGHKPTVGRKKGQKYRVKRNSDERVARTGSWILEAPDSKKAKVDEQVDWLFSRLSKDISKWETITFRYKVDLFCGLFLNGWNRSIGLPPKLLFEIGRRGISLDLDIYSDCPPDWLKKLTKK